MLFNLVWSLDSDIGIMTPFINYNIIRYSKNLMKKVRNTKIYMLHPLLFMVAKDEGNEEELLGFIEVTINPAPVIIPQFIRSSKTPLNSLIDMDYIYGEIEQFIRSYQCIYCVPVQLSNTLSINEKISLDEQIFISKVIEALQRENNGYMISSVDLLMGDTIPIANVQSDEYESDKILLTVIFSNNLSYAITIVNGKSTVEKIAQKVYMYAGGINEFGR